MEVDIQKINLEDEIQEWKSAVCGEEVRKANVSAFEKIQTAVNEAVVAVEDAAAEVNKESGKAAEAVALAEKSIETANTTLTQAEEYSKNAGDSAELAEAWAHGHEKYPENQTDNSEYWSGRSKDYSQQAKNEADRAAAYADYLEPKFVLEDNRIYVNADSTVKFVLDSNKIYFKLPA